LELEPYLGEKMGGEMKDKRKIRVWPYRIIYRIEEKTKCIKVMEIEYWGHTSYD
jgi:mRNA-degrading endonuclease RelE of RelBE toxin-antitoxin system